MKHKKGIIIIGGLLVLLVVGLVVYWYIFADADFRAFTTHKNGLSREDFGRFGMGISRVLALTAEGPGSPLAAGTARALPFPPQPRRAGGCI